MKYKTSFSICTDGSQYDLQATIYYRITSWGRQGSKTPYFGPDELYDPGSPPTFEVLKVVIHDVYADHDAQKWLIDIIVEDECVWSEMIDHALEDREAAREDALEASRADLTVHSGGKA